MDFIPYVIEQTFRGERSYDLYSRMLQDRIIFVGEINSSSARSIVAQMLFCHSQDPEKPITLYIDSPGGGVYAGLGIIDTMNYITCPVHTVGIGLCASFGAVILANGEPGHRGALTNCTVMIHQPHGGAEGQASEIQIQATEIIRLRTVLNEIVAKRTNQPIEKITEDMDRDHFMNAYDAKEYGIVDYVVGSLSDH